MTCTPQLIEHLRSIAAVRAEFPRRRGRGIVARVQMERDRLYPQMDDSHVPTALLALAITRTCDECGIEIADVVADEALREEVIDAALPTYLMLREGWADE